MPSFTYTTGIPVGNQSPATQRTGLQTNTTSVNDILGVDHYSFNDSNGGYHSKSTYVDQVSDPAAISGADIVYAKTVNGLIELFMRRPTESGIQLSTASPVIGAAFGGGGAASGQTFLPGGLQLKWGTATIGGGGSVTITFTGIGLTAFPTKGLTAWAVGFSTPATFNITGVTQTTVTVSGTAATNCLWFALGA